MIKLLHRLIQFIARSEERFNARFGWFFTNGMKMPRHPSDAGLRASRTRSSPR